MSKQKLSSIQAEMFVKRKEYITPHYLRIYLTGEMLGRFINTTVGVNNKILIPPKGLEKIHFPEFDYELGQWKNQPDTIRPQIRTYTHRGIDLEKQEMWIDFIAHGEEGPASAWAINCKEGDVLGVMMHDGKTELYPESESYLLVCDATGIPVIGAILETLPENAKGICIIEVYDESEKQKLSTHANIEMIWLYNKHPENGSELLSYVKQQKLTTGNKFGYVAAEFTSVKQIRSYLRKELNWKLDELNAYSYWKSGVSEDRSTNDRQKEKIEIQ